MNSKLSLIAIAIIGLMFLSVPVKATETFNETFSFIGAGQNSETLTDNGGFLALDGQPIGRITNLYNNFDQQKTPNNYTFPNTVKDTIGTLTISLGASQAGINYNATPFTATVAGQSFGSGNLGWQRTTGNNFNYFINFDSVNSAYASTLTGKQEIVLTYSTTIFDGLFTSNSGGAGDVGFDCNYNYFKVYVEAQARNVITGKACVGVSAQTVKFSFSDASTLTFNDVSTHYGYVNLTKNGFNQRLNVTNSTNYSYYDVTSTTNVSRYTLKDTGIYAQTYDVISGLWANRTLVLNGGVVPTPSPTPTPAPTAPPIPGGQTAAIAFNAANYNVNDNGLILTNIDENNIFSNYRVDFYSDTIPLLNQFSLDMSSSTHTFNVNFPASGTYTANLVKHSNILGSDTIIATDTAQVIMNASLLSVPSIVSVGSLNNISFILGYTPNHTTDTINIRIYDSNGALESIYGVSDANTVRDTRYYTNVRYQKEGNYITQLTSSAFGILDSKASQAYFTPKNVTRNIPAPSFINVSQTFYAFSDTIEYGYQIDDANYTNYSNYIAVYNWNQSVTTRIIDTCGKQWSWLVHLPIVNGLVLNENCDTYDLQNDGFLSGLNKLSLRGQNSTSDIELAYVNFTIASTDSDGWGMSVDKNKICTGETIRLKVIVPGTSAGYLKYGISGEMTTISVNKTATFPFTPAESADFIFELYDNSNTLRKIENVKVSDCVAATPPPTQSEKSTVNIVDGWVGLMGLGINAITKFLFAWFWVTIFMAIGLARSEGKPLMGTIFGLFPFGFFVFIAYLPTWFIIVLILEVLASTRVFK